MSGSTFLPNLNNLIGGLKKERWNYVLVLGILVLLSLLFVYQVIFSLYDMGAVITTSQEQINKIDNLHTKIRVNNPQMAANPAVADWHLFGDAPILLNTQNSKYTLVGIEYTAQDPSQAKVFLTTNNGEPEIYSVGDKMPDGVIIQSISENEVTLLRDGTKEKLSLVWESGGGVPNIPNVNMMNQYQSLAPQSIPNVTREQLQWQMPR